MASVEWNKKEELVAEQALKHLKVCVCPVCCVPTPYFYRTTQQCSYHSVREVPHN